MKYQFIAAHRQEYPVSTMCRVLEVAVSGFYAWLRRAPSRRSQENTGLGEQIVRIYQQNRQVYGSPRIHAVLRAEGKPCGKKRVARLMRELGLSARPRKHRTRTTDSQHEQPVAPNLLNREFTATAPNTKWKAGSIWRWCSISSRAWWWAGPWMPTAMKRWWSKRLAWPWRNGSRSQASCIIRIGAVSIARPTTASCWRSQAS